MYRGFRQAAPREVRNITDAEFKAVAESLQPQYGTVVTTCLRRQSKHSVIFVKKRPGDIVNFDEGLCSFEQYSNKFDSPLHKTVTDGVKNNLVRNGHVNASFFN